MGNKRMKKGRVHWRDMVAISCVAALMALFVPVSAFAGEGAAAKSKARFCLIIPPDVRKAADATPRKVMPAPAQEKAPLKERHPSFFSGNVEKVGVGAPDCFQTVVREKKTSFAGNDMIYRDLNGYVEALNGDLEIRPFFPSVGYFNRASKDGKSAVAVGLGVMGPSEVPDEGEPRNPSAGISLMFGFGF